MMSMWSMLCNSCSAASFMCFRQVLVGVKVVRCIA